MLDIATRPPCLGCTRTPVATVASLLFSVSPNGCLFAQRGLATRFNGYFYLITLYEQVPNPLGPHCNSDSNRWTACLAEHITRSKDLVTWEESVYGGGMVMGLPDGRNTSGPDHAIIPNSLVDERGTAVQKEFVRNQTDDINRSDMDMVTLPTGQTYVVWGSGNQGVPTSPNPPMGQSVAGIVEGTEQEWVESYFA